MKTAKKKVTPKEAPSVINEILVNVVLDRSGSMSSCRDSTIGGYNEYLNTLRADHNAKYSVSLIQFDKPGSEEGSEPELMVCYLDKPLADVPDLTKETYEPRGMTPLYDAIGETIRRIGERAKGRPVLNVIITDGMENASKEFSQQGIKALLHTKQKEGWTFVFLGANIDSYKVIFSLGIHAQNVSNYDTANVTSMFQNLGASTRCYASTRMETGEARQVLGEEFFTDAQRQEMEAQTVGTGKPGGAGAPPTPFRVPKWNITSQAVKP